MDEDEEVYTMGPERATFGRYAVCLLNLASTMAQVTASFLSDVTVVTAQHVMHKRYEREFKGIVKDYDDTRGIRAGGPVAKDGHGSGAEAEGSP